MAPLMFGVGTSRLPRQSHRNPRNPRNPGSKQGVSWHGPPLYIGSLGKGGLGNGCSALPLRAAGDGPKASVRQGLSQAKGGLRRG
eukprot:8870794-Pyramimonas_sp.AAC.1